GSARRVFLHQSRNLLHEARRPGLLRGRLENRTPPTGIVRSQSIKRSRVMNNYEPPSSRHSKASLFLIGKDSHGHWVVRDEAGLGGGLFVDRAQAVKFAMFENGHQPQAVIMVPHVLELSTKPASPAKDQSTTDAAPALRRVA